MRQVADHVRAEVQQCNSVWWYAVRSAATERGVTMPLTIEQREAVVSEVDTWVGTPYRGWSCVKGAGVDCGQLLYAVYRNCGLIPEINDLPKDYPLFIGLHR